MKRFIFLLFLLIPFIVYSQGGYAIWKSADDLFDSADVSDGVVTITNAETIDSDEISYTNRKSGNLRVTIHFDTTSGSSNKLYFDFKYKVADFGTDSEDWVTVVVDSFELAEDNTTVTYQFSQSTYTFMDDPILAYKISLRQAAGSQVNRAKVGTVYYEP